MAVPALRIPLSGDISDFKKKMDEASNHVGAATRTIAKHFIGLNGGVAAGLLTVAGRVSIVIGAIKLMGAAIRSARSQLAEMVEIANRSQNAGVSPAFYQAFIAGANGAEDRIKGLQDALDHAFQSLKPVLNPDWSVWDEGITKVTAVEQSMRQMRELFNTDQSFNGLQLFREATNEDEKRRAVLAFMIQLRNIGQEVAALDLAEKVFGQKFADDVRRGKESIEDLYNTIERKLKKPDVTNEMAKEAAELDKRLNDAWNTISRNLTPSWNALALAAAEIKGYWVNIVELMARATTASPPVGTGFRRAAGYDPDKNPNDPNTPALPRVNVPSVADRRRRQEQSPLAAGMDAWSSMNDLSGSQPPPPPPAERIPLPVRRPNDIPEIKARTAAISEQFDAIERLINVMQRSNDILEVEFNTLGKSASERERGIAIARAEAAARAANRTLTEDERTKILQLADAYAVLNEKISNLRPLAEFARDAGNLNRQLAETSVNGMRSFEDALIGIVDGTKSVKDAFSDMAKSILSDIARIAIRQSIVAPIANALLGGIMGGLGGTGGGLGTGFSLTGTGGLYAEGGYTGHGGRHQPAGVVHRGEYVFSKSAVNRIGVGNLERLHRGYAEGGPVGMPSIPKAAGLRGGVTIDARDNRNITINGGDQQAVAALTAALVQDRKERHAQVVSIVREARSRGQI